MSEPGGSRRNSMELIGTRAGTAMPAEMRQALHLKGLIPSSIENYSKQELRAYGQLMSKSTNLEKYEFLAALRSLNVNLFFRLVLSHFKDIAPLIYTPTVGEACVNYSHIYPFLYPYKTSIGLFITLNDAENMEMVIENFRQLTPDPVDPEITVITDGSRILGLGDLGVNGMGIPIGKLQLYVAAAGLNPGRTLPIVLDFGTDSERYLNDPLYLGTREHRPDDETFYEATKKVLEGLHRAFPDLLVQFEDFSTDHAFGLLREWRQKILCFNDDIQGTGCVILGGFISAVQQAGIPPKDQRILFLGAGSAGVGVAKQLVDYFVIDHKMSLEKARSMFWFVDSRGMITADRGDTLAKHKVEFARRDNNGVQCKNLEEAIEYVKPTALIGLSTIHKAFSEKILQRMNEINKNSRPIIFPLSNPETKAECTFEEAMRCTDNRVLFASGTAFPEYTIPETSEVRVPGQGNNMYVFPAIGLGAVLCKPEWITDTMIYAVAKALANSRNDEEKEGDELYPRIDRIREVSAELAAAFITQAVRENLVKEPHWLDIVNANMPDNCSSDDDSTIDGRFSKRVLGEVKILMWKPAESVEQYIVEAITNINADEILIVALADMEHDSDIYQSKNLRRFDFGDADDDLEAMQREFLKSSTKPAAKVIRLGNAPPVVGSGEAVSQNLADIEPRSEGSKPVTTKTKISSDDMMGFAQRMNEAIKEFEIKERQTTDKSPEANTSARDSPRKLSLFAQRRLAKQKQGTAPTSDQPTFENADRPSQSAATFLPKLMAPVPEHTVVEPAVAPQIQPRESGFPDIPTDYVEGKTDKQAQMAGGQSGIHWDDMRRQISQENEGRIQGMSESEILEAQDEIRSMVSSDVIERLLHRKQRQAEDPKMQTLTEQRADTDTSDQTEHNNGTPTRKSSKQVRFADTTFAPNVQETDNAGDISTHVPPPPPAEWVDQDGVVETGAEDAGVNTVDFDNNDTGVDSPFYSEMKRKYFPSEVVEEAKLAWILGHNQAKSPMEQAVLKARQQAAS
ncbi:hypothetical protein LPJ73_001079, partial [Coemansia sp. RSA 2703]